MISGVNMKQLALAAALISMSIGATSAFAEEAAPTAAAPVQTVEQKATACFACHGPGGHSQNPMYPNLAGQYQDYIANALHAYKSGARKNPIMAGMAGGLSDADIKQLALFFAAQPNSPLYTPSLQ